MKSLKLVVLVGWMVLVCATSANAQLGDSIRTAMQKPPKLSLRFDSHGSFITNTPARMTALGLGVKYGRYIKLGFAVNWLNTDIYRQKIVPNDSIGGNDTVNAKLNYGLLSLYANIVVARVKKWEFTMPIEVGFGASSYSYTSALGKRKEYAKGGMFTFEPMFMAEYKVFKWLGVGGGLGLRLIPINNRLMKENFNSLLWDANVSIYFGEIYKAIAKSIRNKREEKKDGK